MAKAAAAKTATPKPKKRSLAANRRARRARANPAPSGARANPPVTSDITHVILPGFAAYAATRVLARIVYSMVQSRWPSLGKHAAAVSGITAFGATWFFAHKIKQLAPFHDGILVGSGVAALHGMATCYLPEKYSWLLTDCKPEDVTPIDAATSPDPAAAPPPGSIDAAAGDEYSYLEGQLEQAEARPSRSSRTIRAPRSRAGKPVAHAMGMAGGSEPGVALDPDLTSELDPGESVDDLYSGAFEN